MRKGSRTANATDLHRRALLKAIGVGALAAGGLARPASAAMPAMQVAEVAPGVFAFEGAHEPMTPDNHGAVANLGFVVGRESVAVIDSGGSLVEARALLDAIRAATDRPVRHLVCTHMHPDHIFGNAAFRDIGATIVGHRNLPRALAARGDFYLDSYRRQIGADLMQGVEIVPPEMLVDDTLELDLGDRVLELRAWKPAHTDNDLTALDRESRTLFAGDLVFIGHLPTLDGSLLGWIGQLDTLAVVDAIRTVPGHGPAGAPWPEALDAERAYFEALAADIRRAIEDGVPLAEAVETAAAGERGKWELFDEYNQRNATAAYAELEWE